jgi:hypothetical protein
MKEQISMRELAAAHHRAKIEFRSGERDYRLVYEQAFVTLLFRIKPSATVAGSAFWGFETKRSMQWPTL